MLANKFQDFHAKAKFLMNEYNVSKNFYETSKAIFIPTLITIVMMLCTKRLNFFVFAKDLLLLVSSAFLIRVVYIRQAYPKFELCEEINERNNHPHRSYYVTAVSTGLLWNAVYSPHLEVKLATILINATVLTFAHLCHEFAPESCSKVKEDCESICNQ